MNSIQQSGLNIVTQAMYSASKTSQEIAEVNLPESDTNLTESVVELNQAELLSMAGAKVIHTADEVVGTLIDTTA